MTRVPLSPLLVLVHGQPSSRSVLHSAYLSWKDNRRIDMKLYAVSWKNPALALEEGS